MTNHRKTRMRMSTGSYQPTGKMTKVNDICLVIYRQQLKWVVVGGGGGLHATTDTDRQ